MARRAAGLQDALSEHGDDWIASLEDRYGEACDKWQALLDSVTAAYDALAAVESLRLFCQRGRYWHPAVLSPYVGKLPENVGLDAAIAVLRDFASPEPNEQQATAERVA